MRSYPEDEYDIKELEKLKAPQWMLECLKKNPDYTSWGNHEDYMCGGKGWDAPAEISSVEELWGLDDLNELVNFYFMVYRDNVACKECDQTGLNYETKKLYDDWYDLGQTGHKWSDKITQDEVDALWENNRLRLDFKEKPTAEQVNEWSRRGVFGHDGINSHICIETRAKRLGVYGHCPKCDGEGYIYTADEAHLELQMWFLHPRKGCSRGVLLNNIKEDELPRVIEYLKEAQTRNNERFSKL